MARSREAHHAWQEALPSTWFDSISKVNSHRPKDASPSESPFFRDQSNQHASIISCSIEPSRLRSQACNRRVSKVFLVFGDRRALIEGALRFRDNHRGHGIADHVHQSA